MEERLTMSSVCYLFDDPRFGGVFVSYVGSQVGRVLLPQLQTAGEGVCYYNFLPVFR
jgi:hypothetical protein